jgi:hypothetical protein
MLYGTGSDCIALLGCDFAKASILLNDIGICKELPTPGGNRFSGNRVRYKIAPYSPIPALFRFGHRIAHSNLNQCIDTSSILILRGPIHEQ